MAVPPHHLLCPHITHQKPIKRLAPNRHFCLIKRILHHIIRIQFINLPHNHLHIRLLRFRKQQEFRPRERLKAGQSKSGGFEDLDAGAVLGGYAEGGGRERFGDGMHAVESAGQDEQVVDGDFVERGAEVAVVDQAAGFVDYYEGVDDPVGAT